MYHKFDYDPEGLLEPANMIRLYASGLFPMADESTGEINWFFPEIRTIIPLDDYNIPKSSEKNIERKNFTYKFDSDFLSVVEGCADRESTWISQRLIDAYLKLEKLGHVHTVETYIDDELIGGLYGITYKGAFFGESMFSRVSEASKAALIKLLQRLNEKGFVLLDVQYMTPHLKMFGAKEISFEEYKNLLLIAHDTDCKF